MPAAPPPTALWKTKANDSLFGCRLQWPLCGVWFDSHVKNGGTNNLTAAWSRVLEGQITFQPVAAVRISWEERLPIRVSCSVWGWEGSRSVSDMHSAGAHHGAASEERFHNLQKKICCSECRVCQSERSVASFWGDGRWYKTASVFDWYDVWVMEGLVGNPLQPMSWAKLIKIWVGGQESYLWPQSSPFSRGSTSPNTDVFKVGPDEAGTSGPVWHKQIGCCLITWVNVSAPRFAAYLATSD